MKEFQHLSRLLNEQCIETEEGIAIAIDAKQISPESLQNPSDPDATYRNKGGKGHVGLSVNLVEVRDPKKNVGLILSHDVKQNTHSDAAFGEAFIQDDPLAAQIKILAADGAYYRQTSIEAAKEKHIELNLSSMTGRKAAKETLPVQQFERNEKQLIVKCPAGYEPIRATYEASKQLYTAKFDKNNCAVCPLREQCPMKEQQKYNNVRFTETKLQSDSIRSSMGTERHRELSKFRAGVEGVVSALRRGFQIDDLPVRGLLRSKIWIHAKILAYNFKSATKYKARTA
ncbi:transposase [Paenibacillus alginolyticus]|uniref:Transposase n=1 Tax=Paenibacillus alginolyticus TaxID=59839 RepID=A0ABT4G8K3_9BACL|nr:transposase [Paenibacillus alginolyticus]MCY9667216.1 transposase [Paenibacillus alginolyticus]MCY9692498.1 transposase [Paenibacillus alginolyticus]MEC0144291.1 transposase [Paenibacillus alginolyticus]